MNALIGCNIFGPSTLIAQFLIDAITLNNVFFFWFVCTLALSKHIWRWFLQFTKVTMCYITQRALLFLGWTIRMILQAVMIPCDGRYQ